MSIVLLEPILYEKVYFENWITWRGKYFLAGSDNKSCAWYDHLCATMIIIKYSMHIFITYFKTLFNYINNSLKMTI